MTELERKIQAKIPGEDTGIAVKRSLCAICSPGHHCGVDCYVKDGKIIEQGTHKELLLEKGYYYDLYSKQFEEEASMKAFRIYG